MLCFFRSQSLSLNEIGQYIYGKKESNEEKLKNTSVDESILFELEALFSHIDTDGNSVISEDELYTAMNSTPTKQYSREKVARNNESSCFRRAKYNN